jgi:hypothetical protein
VKRGLSLDNLVVEVMNLIFFWSNNCLDASKVILVVYLKMVLKAVSEGNWRAEWDSDSAHKNQNLCVCGLTVGPFTGHMLSLLLVLRPQLAVLSAYII